MIGNIKKQIITQKYKEEKHRGIDLRSWDFKNKCLLPVIAPEVFQITKMGVDLFGNDYLIGITPITYLRDAFVLKFIHIDYNKNLVIGGVFPKGWTIGYTQIKGNSKEHHLHFEVWHLDIHIDPCIYFDYLNIPWKYKWWGK